MMISLKIKNVSFSFDKPVLQNVDAQFLPGTFTGILGPNGAGKSTLVKIINRWYQPKSGEVLISDRSIKNLKQKDLCKLLTVVEQEHAFDADILVEEMVALGRLPHQSLLCEESEEDKKNILLAMERTDILSLSKRRLSTLSGGEKQRVRIAAALAQNTSILILDEPTSHLDLKHQVELMTLLHSLTLDNLIVIAVLHDINIAALYCDKLMILVDGKIKAEGSPSEVLTSQTIEDAYGCEVDIINHPNRNVPQIALVRRV